MFSTFSSNIDKARHIKQTYDNVVNEMNHVLNTSLNTLIPELYFETLVKKNGNI